MNRFDLVKTLNLRVRAFLLLCTITINDFEKSLECSWNPKHVLSISIISECYLRPERLNTYFRPTVNSAMRATRTLTLSCALSLSTSALWTVPMRLWTLATVTKTAFP